MAKLLPKLKLKMNRVIEERSSQTRHSSDQATYFIDSPTKTVYGADTVRVEGWLIPPAGHKVSGIRVKNAQKFFQIPHGKKRPDVAEAHPNVELSRSLHSGFFTNIKFNDGPMEIQVDYGSGYKTIFATDLIHSIEPLKETYLNPELADHYAEHQNLIENNRTWFYEEAGRTSYFRDDKDPRLIAFYLPQFHPIPENDKAWGEGFTEWTNVVSGKPRFIGHQQPIIPRDTGFYDLRYEATIKQQIDLAKHHGVYGFCFYYYWFSGKLLLEKPLDSFLKHSDWDFNFCICWANENWTKRWDGQAQDVVIAQRYQKADPLKFAQAIEPILLDRRYIKVDGKPLLMIYRPLDLKEPETYTKVIRQYFKSHHRVELYLVAVMGFDVSDPRKLGFDAGLDFAPQTSFFKHDVFKNKKFPYLTKTEQLLDINFNGQVGDYRQLALTPGQYPFFNFPTYKSVPAGWDNEARRKGSGFSLANRTPDLYAVWLNRVLGLEKKAAPLVFINAWNEWAESAVLEPTVHEGRAVLNRTTEVLSLYSQNKLNRKNWPLHGINKNPKAKLAVIAHVFYPDQWPEIQKGLKLLEPKAYDLFVSLNLKDKFFAKKITKFKAEAVVRVVPNRGRDVLPFMILANRLESLGYEYVLKLHTKKSLHRADGKSWFDHVLSNLLPSRDVIASVINHLENGSALIGPAGHYVSLERYMGSNQKRIKNILADISAKDLGNITNKAYFAGTMFWARLDKLKPLLNYHFLPADFESEQGQIDGTLAHALERLLGLLPAINGEKIEQVSIKGVASIKSGDSVRHYPFAP